MATLNQFQHFSQGENTVTNNVLLMMSNLYEINPLYYEEFIRGLTEDTELFQVIPNFSQQVGNRGDGIIDGHIQIKASKIIIETKLHGLEWINKLVKYAKSFDENEYKLLFHLSSSRYSPQQIEKVNQKILESNFKGKVNFYSITFQDMVDQLMEIARGHKFEHHLQRLNEHFESYCLNMGLMPRSNHILRAMACGQSFDLNVKYQFYFDLASRGYRDFNYLGIYKWKSVRFIGKIENTVVANWSDDDGLTVLDSENEFTEAQKTRLIAAIKESNEHDWDLYDEVRYFLLNEFKETDFNKTSPGGIFRVRYFNLEDHLDPMPESFSEVAEQLKLKSWE